MKILSAEQIRALDKYTIENEPVASIDLMERAAGKLVEALTGKIPHTNKVFVICGTGNNGGDGLAVARMLLQRGYFHVSIYVIRGAANASADFRINEGRLTGIQYIDTEQQIPGINPGSVVVDAIFGSGLSRSAEGIYATVIQAINKAGATVYSIDIPSGLYCDKPNGPGDAIVNSTLTYTFHAPKLSFMFAANGKHVPRFEVLDIGLSQAFADNLDSPYRYTSAGSIHRLWRRRDKFSHKGTYGHALIAAGSYGKMGAAVLAVKTALRSGTGLVTAHIPACGYDIMQVSTPEAMASVDKDSHILSGTPDVTPYSAIGAGPGIGTAEKTGVFVKQILSTGKPLVLDADALNIIAGDKNLMKLIPENSILSPHPGEFKRLAGNWSNDLDKLQILTDLSKNYNVVVALKGAHTAVATPGGLVYFNSTGNAGMAKGGTGDVLTGVLTALLAQGYTAEQAAIIGVYIHGLAGDYAKTQLGETAIKATDIIYYLPQAFKAIEAP